MEARSCERKPDLKQKKPAPFSAHLWSPLLPPSSSGRSQFTTLNANGFFHFEPDGIKSGKKEQRKHCACADTANQHVGQRAPERRVRERNESQHRGDSRKNDRACS